MKDKFAADGMLGSLDRKLRIFGYDTTYNTEIDEYKILEIARNDNRTILTSNRKLHQNATKYKIRCILLNEENDLERLCEVLNGKKDHSYPLMIRDAQFVMAI